MQKRIIIAAGHGGGDSGATGQGTTEATETIQIVGRLDALLRADGRFEVVHVPDEDGLVSEIQWINARYKNLEDGLALEIHKNAGGGHGSQTLYYDGSSQSLDMANKISAALHDVTGLPNRGVERDDDPALVARIGGPLGWTREVTMWSLLVEAGFVDSDPVNDDWDNRFAQGIYQGILRIYGLGPATPAPAPQPPAGAVHAAGVVNMPLCRVTVLADQVNVRAMPHLSAQGHLGNVHTDGLLYTNDQIDVNGWVHGDSVTLPGFGTSDLWLRTTIGHYVWAPVTNWTMPQAPAPVSSAAAQLPATPPVVPAPDLPQPATTPETAPVEAGKGAASFEDAYKSNADGIQVFNANADYTVKDLAGINPDMQLKQGMIVHVAGYFAGPDNKLYARTDGSVKAGRWYGIDPAVLTAQPERVVKQLTDVTPAPAVKPVVAEPTPQAAAVEVSKIVQVAAGIYGAWQKLIHLIKR